MNQLRGDFARAIGELREGLIGFAGLLELELDFAEEDVEFADRSQFDALLGDLLGKVSSLADSFRTGNAIREGIPVAIIGAPNRGKSTLLNALLGDERAIVSATAGTTRDTIEDTCIISGKKFRFIDTAGIRETTDEIESEGIRGVWQNNSRRGGPRRMPRHGVSGARHLHWRGHGGNRCARLHLYPNRTRPLAHRRRMPARRAG